ncbi:MAG: ABC transporter permease [Acidobacteriota bacterium]
MSDTAILFQQAKRAWIIAKKDIRVYYYKGPVIIFGILFPVFLFLSFAVGRDLPFEFLVPGLLGMVLFFTSTSISPAVAPWETQAKTLERLMSAPLKTPTIILGDILASFVYGFLVSMVPVVACVGLGIKIRHPVILMLGIILAGFCFSSLGLIFSAAPTSMPSTIMMLSVMVKFPVVFISGIFIPLDQLPEWGRVISFVSPLTYFTDIARQCIQNQGYFSLGFDFFMLAAFTVVFLLFAMVTHQRTMPKRI